MKSFAKVLFSILLVASCSTEPEEQSSLDALAVPMEDGNKQVVQLVFLETQKGESPYFVSFECPGESDEECLYTYTYDVVKDNQTVNITYFPYSLMVSESEGALLFESTSERQSDNESEPRAYEGAGDMPPSYQKIGIIRDWSSVTDFGESTSVIVNLQMEKDLFATLQRTMDMKDGERIQNLSDWQQYAHCRVKCKVPDSFKQDDAWKGKDHHILDIPYTEDLRRQAYFNDTLLENICFLKFQHVYDKDFNKTASAIGETDSDPIKFPWGTAVIDEKVCY